VSSSNAARWTKRWHSDSRDRERMNGGAATNQELAALRLALWEIAERAQRAIVQLDAYVRAQRDANRPGAADAVSRSIDRSANAQPPESPQLASSSLLTTQASPRPGHCREVARALRHIEMHFDQPIGLARLSRVARCSRSTLTRAFRRELGQTPREYLVRIRLARAASAMSNGDKIESVMLGVGFRSKRSFYRLFKAQFGRTPAQFGQAMPHQGGGTG
jgi:AraC-like DNA-binding protein